MEIEQAFATLSQDADPVARLILEAERKEQQWRDEAAAANAKARDAAKLAATLKERLIAELDVVGANRAQGQRYTCQVLPSPIAIRWEGEGEIPEGFRRVKIELDAARAKVAHADGRLPEGFAVTQGRHVRII